METSRIAKFATGLVAISSGVLSAVATHDVAIETGAVTEPFLGWLLPLIIEGGAVTAAVLAWSRTKASEPALAERTALGALMGLALWVNGSHASGESVLGVVLAACPALVLIVSIEMLLRSMRAPRRRSKRTVEQPSKSKPLPTPVSTSKAKREHVSTPAVAQSPVRGLPVSPSEREIVVASLLAEQPGLTALQAAEHLGISRSAAGKVLTAVRRGGSREQQVS